MSKSPSLVAEWDALRRWGDRTSRAILAIFHARRCAQSEDFFVAPHIVKLNKLSPKDLNWALDKLEGKLVVTRRSKKGKWRMLRLIPEVEETLTKPPPQGAQKEGEATGNLLFDEERVVFDKVDILRRAASPIDKMPDEVVETLREISAQASVR